LDSLDIVNAFIAGLLLSILTLPLPLRFTKWLRSEFIDPYEDEDSDSDD